MKPVNFGVWMGVSARFMVCVGTSRFPLFGRLVSKSAANVRIRVADCMEIDVPQEWIAEVQADVPKESGPEPGLREKA